MICHYHFKQLYGLSFQDVGTLFGGEQEPSFDVASVRLAWKTAENEMGVWRWEGKSAWVLLLLIGNNVKTLKIVGCDAINYSELCYTVSKVD